MNFVGGKGQNGLFHAIINLIPPHAVFIEPFAGLAAITRRKKPAAETFVVDLKRNPALVLPAGVRFVRGCGIRFLDSFAWTGREVVYCDPPYLLSTRGNHEYYPHEFTTADHEKLLAVLNRIPARVLLSGYHSPFYDDALAGWNLQEVATFTRNHSPRTECLWFNYPRPTALHEYTVTGEGYRERLRIKRKAIRWAERLKRQSPLERAALFSALVDVMGAGVIRTAVNEAAGAPAPRASSGVVDLRAGNDATGPAGVLARSDAGSSGPARQK